MGVDLDTYRCRVWTFVSHHGAGLWMLPFHIDYSLLIKMIGTVSFVRILLLISGIEQNPGPGKFVFRYQYLLVHIGSEVLRKLFDIVAGNDVGKYLAHKVKDIQKLINAKIITASQKELLPPVNNTPQRSYFDITLISCLLRNICGLCPPNDPVWMNAAQADNSLEADITRLRMCRNELMHSDKLRLPSVELDAKWRDLSMILTRLNKIAGVAQLPKLINDAEQMDVDEELRNEYNKTIAEWASFDTRMEEVMNEVWNVKHEIDEVKRRVEHLEQRQQAQVIDLKDVQRDIIRIYKYHCRILPVLPLFETVDEDLFHIYQSPTMYSVEQTEDVKTQIDCYRDIFYKKNKPCQQIYITGDAGIGKTSFCIHLCLLWSMAKCGDKLSNECKKFLKDIDYISQFEYVFFINLRDTCHTHVLDMIIEQFYESKEIYELPIRSILRDKRCLVLMDGLDEWSPNKDGRRNYKIPDKIHSENCVYITTCRPYRLESARLSHRKDIDHRIQMTGMDGESSERYVEYVMEYMKKQYCSARTSFDFLSEVSKNGMEDQLCVPMIASHLVLLWFEKTLTVMPRAVIYANILEMLFKRAEQREVRFPPTTISALHLPGSLSGLRYLNEYVNLLYKICYLSFCSIFKQDANITNLVFTREELQSEPYCLTIEDTDFLCKIGVLSKNEVFGCYLVEKLKLSFIHKSYVEFFAALFISSFDSSNSFSGVAERWKCLNDVIQFENCFLFLAGFSYNRINILFENIYLILRDDFTSCRKNALFHYNEYSYRNRIKSLQNIVVNCFKEVSRSSDKTVELRMEDFVFDEYTKNVDILRKLLFLNAANVKYLHCDESKYFDEFDQMKNLQCINIVRVSSADYEKFTQCMLQNKSTLHTVCIQGGYTLIQEFLVRSLHHLTSLCLYRVKMQHNSLQYLVKFLSDSILIENIKLSFVSCDNHQDGANDCSLALNLPNHTKLISLCLRYVNMLCNKVNNSSLQSITLFPLSEMVGLCYSDVFNCIKDSHLEHVYINACRGFMLDNPTMKTLTSTLKTLTCIKSIELRCMKLPDDILLQLHPDVTQVKIKLSCVRMSPPCFHCFIESCVNNKSEIKAELVLCKITSFDGETHSELSYEESVEYMYKHLETISTINITYKDVWLHFVTTSSQ